MCHTISQSLVLTNIQSKSEFASNLLAIGPSCHYLQQKLAPSWSAGYTSHQKLHSEHIRKVNHCSSSQRIWKSWFASVIMPNVLINYKDQLCLTLCNPMNTAWQASSLSVTNSWTLLKLMSIESVVPSSHLILCCPLLPPSVFTSIRIFSNESVLHIMWPKCWRLSFSICMYACFL